ncbi:uncharacterized protein AAG666_006831 [Megaptera novaeangliae]
MASSATWSFSMPHAGGQSPSLDPHKSICHGQQPPPDHSSPSACPLSITYAPRGQAAPPRPPPLHPPIHPPPPTSCWRSALGPGSRAPPMRRDQTASLTSPHRGVLPRAPSEPGALASRTTDAEPTPLALAHPGAGAPFLPRASSPPTSPPAPAGAPITPTAPAPAPGVAPPSSRHTQQPKLGAGNARSPQGSPSPCGPHARGLVLPYGGNRTVPQQGTHQ